MLLIFLKQFLTFSIARLLCNLSLLLFVVEYLSEDGRKIPKHTVGLIYICVLLYLIIVKLSGYIL
jgi:hypothetical protein